MQARLADIALPPCGVLAQESRHRADFVMPAHRHTCPSLLIALGGVGACVIAERRLPLEASDLLLLPAGLGHQVVDDPKRPLTLFVVYVSPEVARRHAPLLAALPTLRTARIAEPGGTEIRRLLRRILYEQGRDLPGRDALIPALLAELFVLAQRHAAPASASPPDARDRVRSTAQAIRERFHEPWSLPDAARAATLSVRAFSKLFREEFGLSFVQYLNQARVEEARRLLRRGDAKVTTVCFEVGFEDLSHFYRVFRRLAGHPPGREKPNRSFAKQGLHSAGKQGQIGNL